MANHPEEVVDPKAAPPARSEVSDAVQQGRLWTTDGRRLLVSWRGTLVRYAGRLDRPRRGKSEIRIFDYVDRQVPLLLRMFERRRRRYRALGYAPAEALRSPCVK